MDFDAKYLLKCLGIMLTGMAVATIIGILILAVI